MDYFKFPNWQEFQHYKSEKRAPEWIKLYARTLRKRHFKMLTEVQQCHLFKLWLAASQERSLDPVLPWDPAHIKDLIYAKCAVNLQVLEDQGFIIRCDASGTAPVPNGTLEREGERDRERDERVEDHSFLRGAEGADASLRAVLAFECAGTPKTWELTAGKLAEWAELYPTLDVLAECKKARQWVRDNPARRKTARGMTRYLNAWLGRAQNRGGGKASERLSTGKERRYGDLG